MVLELNGSRIAHEERVSQLCCVEDVCQVEGIVRRTCCLLKRLRTGLEFVYFSGKAVSYQLCLFLLVSRGRV